MNRAGNKQLGKPQRQHRIARLLEQHAVTSQTQLVELLAADGVAATQATVSRDLEDLGAIKVRVPGGDDRVRHPRAADRAACARGPPAPRLRRLGRRGGALGATWSCCARRRGRPTWSARPSTGPVCADVLGTVAGDDTLIFVVAEEQARVAPRSPQRLRGPGRPESHERKAKRVTKTSGAGVQRRARHVRRGAMDDRRARRRGDRAGGRRRPGERRLGRGARAGRWPPARVEAIVVDAREEFAARLRRPRAARPTRCTRAGTRWCPRCRGPVIVKHLVAAAREHGADAVAHGCTGKGNDQVRFEVSTRALAPDLDVRGAGAVVGHDPRGLHPVRLRPRHPDHGDEGEGVLDRRQPLGSRHRVRRDGGPVGGAAAGRVAR